MVQFGVGVPDDGNLEESIANDSSIFCCLFEVVNVNFVNP